MPIPPPVKPVFILPYSTYSDYRPVIDNDGQQVIFERTIAGIGTVLYRIADLSNPTPQPLFSATYLSSRADWSWITGQIAFNYGPEPTPTGVGIADVGNADPALLIGTGNMDYPVWFPVPASQWLAVMNSQPVTQPATLPVPRTSMMSIAGVVEPPTLSGDMWAGMPSVNQASELVFAGQLPADGTTYNQDNNCIWRTDAGGVNLRPLEANYGGTGSGLPNFQGRAPWWSPDGQWVVFESNRPIPANGQPNGGNPDNQYAIYLYKADQTGGPAMQVTNPEFNMNHAKFFPAGFNGVPGDPQLIVSSWWGPHPAALSGGYQLAKLSIKKFING